MAGIQDFAEVKIGSGKHGSSRSKAGNVTGPKQVGAAGLSGRLENSTAHKLDDNETKPPENITSEVGKAVSAARQKKGWDQKEFARQLNVLKTVVVDLEAGRHKRDNKLLQKCEGRLGVWLTGDAARLGEPKSKEEKTKEPAKAVGKTKTKATKDAEVDRKEEDSSNVKTESETEAEKENKESLNADNAGRD